MPYRQPTDGEQQVYKSKEVYGFDLIKDLQDSTSIPDISQDSFGRIMLEYTKIPRDRDWNETVLIFNDKMKALKENNEITEAEFNSFYANVETKLHDAYIAWLEAHIVELNEESALYGYEVTYSEKENTA